MKKPCPCGSGSELVDCCGPILDGSVAATTAEALMRARFSAYSTGSIPFLGDSLHPSVREEHDEEAVRIWSESSEWLGLEIKSVERGGEDDDEGVVEFVASFRDNEGPRSHHERSRFERFEGRWYFVDGETIKPQPIVNATPKVGRNAPCPCGSGKKYKKCCGLAPQ